MPISHEAAHARSVKAAATRARNRAARGVGVKTVPVTTHVPRGGSRAVKKMSASELSGELSRMNAPGYQARASDERRYYAIKDELRDRATKRRYGRTTREAGEQVLREARERKRAHRERIKREARYNPSTRTRKSLEDLKREQVAIDREARELATTSRYNITKQNRLETLIHRSATLTGKIREREQRAARTARKKSGEK